MRYIIAYLLVDLVCGFVHWFEDTYLHPSTWLVGPWIIAANRQHHSNQRAFTKNGFWSANYTQIIASIIIVVSLWNYIQHGPLMVFGLFASMSNEIHRWSHRTPRENGKLITILQRSRLIQDQRYHAKHHTSPNQIQYCVITPFVNWFVDPWLWRLLEKVNPMRPTR